MRLHTPPEFPPGDLRNELAFRLSLAAFFFDILGAIAIGALRTARRDRTWLEPPGLEDR